MFLDAAYFYFCFDFAHHPNLLHIDIYVLLSSI